MLTKIMNVIAIKEFGPPHVLYLTKRPIPQPNFGEVLIKVIASGINRTDIFQRSGRYLLPLGMPAVLGLEVSGIIISGSFDEARGIIQGAQVVALLTGGGYAEYVVAPVSQCLPIPSNLNNVEAASLPECLFTVWNNIFERGLLGRGERGNNEILLVQGGSSGIGIMAIQLASTFGFSVFATAGSTKKCTLCKRLGALQVINYNTEDFVEKILFFTKQHGVDVILDIVGGDYVPRELKILANGGRLVIIGLLRGSKSEISLYEIMQRRLTITGSTLMQRSINFKAKITTQLFKQVWPLIETGYIKPVIFKVLPSSEVIKAHSLMESNKHIGKIILSW